MPRATVTKEKMVKKAPSTRRKAEVGEPTLSVGSKATFAVIETGGKQYMVSPGDSIKIEIMKGNMKEGSKITFDKVLLTHNGSVSKIGFPFITGATVSGTLTEIGRNKKVTVIHYKQKSRYFKKAGHRQPYFKVLIDKIA